MVTKAEHEYLYKKAVAWENECIAAKQCLWKIVLEAAKIETNLRDDPIDFDDIKSILRSNGFIGFYDEAFKKIEEEAWIDHSQVCQPELKNKGKKSG